MFETRSQFFSKHVMTLSLSVMLMSSIFILIQILRFDTALWDHYAAFNLYLGDYQSSDFSVLNSWIKGLTTTNLTYRPTHNFLIAIQYKLMGTSFPYYYVCKWLIFMGTIILMVRRLMLLKVSSWAALCFAAIVLTHPASPLLMLFSGDLYIVFFACILFEIALLFFQETKTAVLIALGITGALVSFLAGGTKEVAPPLMGLVVIWAWLVAGNLKSSLFRCLCLIAPLIPSAIGVLLTAMNQKSSSALPKSKIDFIYTFGEGILGALPVGRSFIICLGCLLIFCLYLWRIRASNHALRDPKIISCFLSFAIALAGLAIHSVALPPWSSFIADRYIFTSMFFIAVGLVIACNTLFIDLKPKVLACGKFVIVATMALVMFIGLSGQAHQMNSYLAYFSHINQNLKSISSLTAAKGEVRISGNIGSGEVSYNIEQIFTHYYKKYNLTYYKPSVFNIDEPSSEVVWVFSGHTFDTFRARSAIAGITAGQQIEKIELADAPTDRFLSYLSRPYLRLLSHRGDIGAPYLIDWRHQLKLNHEFRIYRIKVGPGVNSSYERQLKRIAESNDIYEDHLVFSFILKEGHATIFTEEFIRESVEQVGVVIQGKIMTDKPEAIAFGLREKNGHDITNTTLSRHGTTESGEFMFYFDVDQLEPGVPYEFFVFSMGDAGRVVIEKSILFTPVTRF